MSVSVNFVFLTRISLYFQADKVKFDLRLGQSKPIYNAFKAIQESSDWHKLSDARKRIVESKFQNIFSLCCTCNIYAVLFLLYWHVLFLLHYKISLSYVVLLISFALGCILIPLPIGEYRCWLVLVCIH